MDFTINSSRPDLQINKPGSFVVNGSKVIPNPNDEATMKRYSEEKKNDKKNNPAEKPAGTK